jgi:hypothetical protein
MFTNLAAEKSSVRGWVARWLAGLFANLFQIDNLSIEPAMVRFCLAGILRWNGTGTGGTMNGPIKTLSPEIY